MLKRTLLPAALVAALTLSLSSGALGGNGLPPLTVDPQSGQPGDSFTVSGTECSFDVNGDSQAAGENGLLGPLVEVTVNFPTPETKTTNADPVTGSWSVTFTVPAGTPPGTYTVTAICHDQVNGDLGAAGGDVGAAQTSYPPGTVFTVNAPPSVPVEPPPAPADAAPAPAPPAVGAAPQLTG